MNMPASQPVQSVLRAIDLLNVVAESDDGLRLVDVCADTGLKTTTAHNLLRTLAERGFLVQSDDAAWRLGPALRDLAEREQANSTMRAAAGILRRLAARFPKATLTFAQRSGVEVVVRLRMSPDRPGLLQRPHGVTFMPYGSASGLALMAHLDEDERAAVRERYPFHEFGARLWGTADELDAFLRSVQERGPAVPPFPGQVGWRAAAVAKSPAGWPMGTIGASLRHRTDANTTELSAALVGAANELQATVQPERKADDHVAE